MDAKRLTKRQRRALINLYTAQGHWRYVPPKAGAELVALGLAEMCPVIVHGQVEYRITETGLQEMAGGHVNW